MTDGVTLNSGTGGATVDTELCPTRGFMVQRVKVILGATDVDGGNVSAANAFPVALANNAIGAASISTTQATVGTSSALMIAARTGAIGTGRVAVTIYNTGTATIAYGPSGVSMTTGMLLPAGGAVTVNVTAALYAISGTAGQVVCIQETY